MCGGYDARRRHCHCRVDDLGSRGVRSCRGAESRPDRPRSSLSPHTSISPAQNTAARSGARRRQSPVAQSRIVAAPVVQASHASTAAPAAAPMLSPRMHPLRRYRPLRRRRSHRPRRDRGQGHSDMQQSECARPFPHRGDRHHRRSRFRHRALQAIRLPARQGSRADLRRRTLAGQHARWCSRRSPTIAPKRRSSRSANTRRGTPTFRKHAGRGRHDDRQPHLVAQGFGQESLCQGYRAGQARDRDGRERRAYGGRRPDRAVLPLPRSAAAARL